MENIINTPTSSQPMDAATPSLVFLHGTSGFSEDWSGVIGRLAENRVVIRSDYMNSQAMNSAAHSTTLPEAACHVLSDVATQASGPFDLVGYSLGAGVAAFIAAEHPEMVRSLVLISGFGYGGDIRMKLQFGLWVDLVRSNRMELARLLLLTGLSREFLSNFDEGAINGIVERFVGSTDWESVEHSIQLDIDIDVRAHTRKIAAPTLSIAAKHDQIVPEFYSQQLVSLMHDVERAELNSGHLSFLEQPTQLVTVIANFLDSRRI